MLSKINQNDKPIIIEIQMHELLSAGSLSMYVNNLESPRSQQREGDGERIEVDKTKYADKDNRRRRALGSGSCRNLFCNLSMKQLHTRMNFNYRDWLIVVEPILVRHKVLMITNTNEIYT